MARRKINKAAFDASNPKSTGQARVKCGRGRANITGKGKGRPGKKCALKG